YESYGRHYSEAPGAATALLKCADIEWKVLNNPGRAQYVCQELLSKPLPPDVERLARERLRAVEEALALQRGAAYPARAGSSTRRGPCSYSWSRRGRRGTGAPS